MVAKTGLRLLTLALVLAMTPVVAAAQESVLDVQEPDSQPASQLVAEEQPVSDSESEIAAPLSSSSPSAFVAPPAFDLSTSEDLRADGESTSPFPASAAKGSGSGLGFMIAGGAALVGGLLIGGTAGNLIAAGGVGLGVYGIIIYF